ncbi:MAG: Hsp20/alpha crystallin family protein [Verrucomicrobia bacterium]|nr:Hsp20/alpha crystallin family protein [Verrucomicrobiota bacterium]
MNAIAKLDRREVSEQEPAKCPSYLSPRVNIVETQTAYILEAEMPGVNKECLEVLLEGHELTLVGRRTSDTPDARLIYRETTPKNFRRVFVLDPTIDTAKIDARMENGVLFVHLPKAEKVRPRKITISG